MRSLSSRGAAVKGSSRTARVMTLGASNILWLTAGHDTTAYRVTPLPCDFGRAAFRLDKADKGDGPGETYYVLLAGDNSSCECKGFLKHGLCKDGKGCKHIAGCKAALEAGQLAAAPQLRQLDAQDEDALADGEAALLEGF
jgi:hypothetical protein